MPGRMQDIRQNPSDSTALPFLHPAEDMREHKSLTSISSFSEVIIFFYLCGRVSGRDDSTGHTA
jgi:hypothetical protein